MKKLQKKGKFYPEFLPKPLLKNELESIIDKAKEKVNSIKLMNNENYNQLLIGNIMDDFRIQVDGSDLTKIIT